MSRNSEGPRRASAGSVVDDLCRACKSVRAHTVFAAQPDGTILRVVCDHCGSQHNYRGGGRSVSARPSSAAPRSAGQAGEDGPAHFPLVTDRERSFSRMSDSTDASNSSGAPSAPDLELLLRRVIREEAGLTPAVPADKWRGGEMVLRPGKEGLQEKTWPIETFFHKVVMVRNRLRVLEQQINGSDLPADAKVKMQGYVTACYGSLTSFNVLFAEEEDRFKGAGGAGGAGGL